MDPGGSMVRGSRTMGRETGRPTRSTGDKGGSERIRADWGVLGARKGSKKKVDRRRSQDDEGWASLDVSDLPVSSQDKDYLFFGRKSVGVNERVAIWRDGLARLGLVREGVEASLVWVRIRAC